MAVTESNIRPIPLPGWPDRPNYEIEIRHHVHHFIHRMCDVIIELILMGGQKSKLLANYQ